MKKKKGKKRYAEPEMGYCPFSIRQSDAGHGLEGRGTRAAGGRGAAGARAQAVGSRQAQGATGLAAWACSWANGLCTQPVFGPV